MIYQISLKLMSSTPQNSEQQVTKRTFRSEVTEKDSRDFLSRPPQNIPNLDRNLRKSYHQDYFKGQEFEGLREVYRLNKNNIDLSSDSEINEDDNDSDFSLHNDQKTRKRKERQKILKKKKKQQEEKGQNIQKPTLSANNLTKKKRKKVQIKQEKEEKGEQVNEEKQQKDGKEEKEGKEGKEGKENNEDNEEKQSSQSGSSHSTSSEEQSEVQNSENSEKENSKSQQENSEHQQQENEQQDQKVLTDDKGEKQPHISSENSRKAVEGSEYSKISPEKIELPEMEQQVKNNEQESQNEVQNEPQPQEESQAEMQQQQQLEKKSNEMIDEKQAEQQFSNKSQEIVPAPRRRRQFGKSRQSKKVLHQEKKQGGQKGPSSKKVSAVNQLPKEYRLLFSSEKQAEEMLNKHPVRARNAQIVKQEDNNSVTSSQNGKESKIGTKSKNKQPNNEVQNVIAITINKKTGQNSKKRKSETQPENNKMKQQPNISKLIQVIPEQIVTVSKFQGEPARRGCIYRIEPTTRIHNLQLCQKVIVQSMFFSSHINPPLYSEYRKRVNVDVVQKNLSFKEQKAIVRKKRIVQPLPKDSQEEPQMIKNKSEGQEIVTRSKDKKLSKSHSKHK